MGTNINLLLQFSERLVSLLGLDKNEIGLLLNMGAILKAPRPPTVNVCPSAKSIKSIGTSQYKTQEKWYKEGITPVFVA